MEKFVFGSFWFLSMTFLCLADDVTDNELIQTLLGDNSKDKLRDLVDEYLMEEENAVKINSLLDPQTRQLSVPKRIFCNGNSGCFNEMRRDNAEDKDSNIPFIRKRPFCNGFFGCQNGKKRSFNILPDMSSARIDTPNSNQKRLFCNMYGCGNHGKRSMLLSKLFGRLGSGADRKSLEV